VVVFVFEVVTVVLLKIPGGLGSLPGC